MPPDRGLSNKKQSGVKGNKVRITYLFVANATGSDKLPPLIIGKAKKPRAFKGKTGAQLGFNYWNNAKAWMTGSIYHMFLSDWNDELVKQNRNILLLHDNFSAHVCIPTDQLSNIHIEPFRANLTAHVQPMDAGIISSFKAHYRSQFAHRALERHDRGVTPSEIYNINQLEGMRLAEQAWNRVTAKTIQNCFIKAGTVVRSDSVPAQSSSSVLASLDIDDGQRETEQEIQRELDSLEERGLLHKKNRLTVDELVNSPAEAINGYADISDAELFSAVTEARQLDLEERDSNDDPEIQPRPRRQDVLRAAEVIRSYTEDMNGQLAREVEVLIGKLSRELRLEEQQALKPTFIDSFFTRK